MEDDMEINRIKSTGVALGAQLIKAKGKIYECYKKGNNEVQRGWKIFLKNFPALNKPSDDFILFHLL